MSFDWLHYYTLAQDLIGIKPSHPVNEEAKLRAAISRAYYAAHWITRNYLKEKYNFVPGKGDEHGGIWRELYKGPPKYPESFIMLGSQLERLYDYRRKADYEANLSVNMVTTAKTALQMANKIISTFHKV